MEEKTKIAALVSIVSLVAVIIIAVFAIIFDQTDKISNSLETIQEITQTTKDLVVSDNTKALAEETTTDEDLSSVEVASANVDENALEADATVQQENIAYNGDITGDGQALLSGNPTLTYYSQTDSRWANVMYSSTGNPTQTIGSSGCGSTSAAMVISSSKGKILPTTTSSLFVDNGYRTANNGTAWSAYSFVADYFGFNEFYDTYSFNTATNYLKQDKDNDGNADYYVIASCGSGLWTSSGHYICMMSDKDGTIMVYDPYLYNGKFNTASRRAAGVVVSGNSAFVSEGSFYAYSNAQHYWIFSNDSGSSVVPTQNTTIRYVATESANLNVRNTPNGTIVSSLPKGSAVTVYETSGTWARIGTNRWVSSIYLSSAPVSTSTSTSGTTSTSTTYTRYVSTNSKSLNVRYSPNGKIVGSISKGSAVTVYATSGNWAKIGTNRWVSLSYLSGGSTTKTISTSSSYTTGTYKVTASLLNVRTGAGTNYSAKSWSQLTANARKQNQQLGNYYANGYKKGVVCTITKVSGHFGLSSSGWLCLDYCTKIK